MKPELRSKMGSAPALGCGFPRPRGKPAWHEAAESFHELAARPDAGCEGAAGDTRGRVCSPDGGVRGKPGGSSGYALLTVMIFSSIGLLALGTAMQWTNQSALLNERATESRSALMAAEATTEKVAAAMSADFQRGGETLVHANTATYTGLLPTAAENPYWQNFQFADGRGNNGETYVQRISTRIYKPLESRFTGLNGFISEYVIASHARSTDGRYNPANAVEQRIQLASIPVYQFAVFFNGLMEFTWAAPFTVRGRVHGNNNIYTGSSQPLIFQGDVTSVGVQMTRTWGGYDIASLTGSLTYSGKRATNAASVSLPIGTNNTDSAVREIIQKPPASEAISSAMGHERFYNKAELLILVSNSTITASVKQAYDGAPLAIPAAELSAFISTNKTFKDQRENKTVQVTEIDVGKFTLWAATNSTVRAKLGPATPPNTIFVSDDRTQGASFIAGVRLVNGQTLPSRGLTVATPNPLYVKGHYNCPVTSELGTTNTTGALPASLVADALTLQSGGWVDGASNGTLGTRPATDTTINAAIIAGMVASGGSDGSSPFSGGVMNLPRLLEDWGNGARQLTINGSLISLYTSARATAPWRTPGNYYYAPTRSFNFDSNLLRSTSQPPATPEFRVLLRSSWSNPVASL